MTSAFPQTDAARRARADFAPPDAPLAMPVQILEAGPGRGPGGRAVGWSVWRALSGLRGGTSAG